MGRCDGGGRQRLDPGFLHPVADDQDAVVNGLGGLADSLELLELFEGLEAGQIPAGENLANGFVRQAPGLGSKAQALNAGFSEDLLGLGPGIAAGGDPFGFAAGEHGDVIDALNLLEVVLDGCHICVIVTIN